MARSNSNIQKHFRVILLEPKESLNIGSVARAMMNMGFADLLIVNPKSFDLERAAITARKARLLFDPPKIVSTLEEALTGCTFVAGFSTKDSKNTPPVILLDKWAENISDLVQPENSKIGLLFGPEDTGLRYEHLPVCNTIVRIPSCDEYDSLNLAQAALLVFYSIASKHIDSGAVESEAVAISEQLHALDNLIMEIGKSSEFFNEGTPENTIGLLRNLFKRPVLTHREMQIVLGFFSRIRKSLG
jgi:TrmH family RNA methyltransferase